VCWQQIFLKRLQIEPLLGRRDTFLCLMHELFEGWLGGDVVMKTPIFRGPGLRPWWSFPAPHVTPWLSLVTQQFCSQILSFSRHRQSNCFGSASPLLFRWVFSRYLHAGDRSWAMPIPDSQQSVNPATAQYSGSFSLQGFVVSGGKCPKISGAE